MTDLIYKKVKTYNQFINEKIKISKNAVTLYRGEPIDYSHKSSRFNLKRLELLKDSIGKPYPPYFKDVSVYCSADRSISSSDGYTVANPHYDMNPKTIIKLLTTFTSPLDNCQIDEASVIQSFINIDYDRDVENDIKGEVLKALKKYFGKNAINIVEKNKESFEDALKVSSSENSKKARENVKKSLAKSGKAKVVGDDKKDPFVLSWNELYKKNKKTKKLIEEIRNNVGCVEYFLNHRTSKVEWNITPRDLKKTEIIKVETYDEKNKKWKDIEKSDFKNYDKKNENLYI